jgi:hypothetical protein
MPINAPLPTPPKQHRQVMDEVTKPLRVPFVEWVAIALVLVGVAIFVGTVYLGPLLAYYLTGSLVTYVLFHGK